MLPVTLLPFGGGEQIKACDREKKKGIEILISTEREIYYLDETVTFDIELKTKNPRLLETILIEATFPDETTPVTLEKLSETEYRFAPILSRLGENKLTVKVYKIPE
ncbi:MAG: hypothetical protein N2234_11165, partial [Planctomycetota bacterium]|nr:hypothetical protein [Planctomycetota bacterium]